MKLQVYYCILIMESLISCTPPREIPEIYGKEDALTAYENLEKKFHNSSQPSPNYLISNLKTWNLLNVFHDAKSFLSTVPLQVHTKEQTKALHTLGKQIPPIITQLMERGSINKQLPDNLPNKTIIEYTQITMK